MSMPVFPTYVFINDVGLQRAQMNNVLRSEMEVGPQKTRPIQSTPLFQVQMPISICADKLTEFRTWFKNSLGYGSYYFLMNDPFDGTRRRFRFVETEFSWEKTGNNLQTTITLESYDEL